MTRATCPDSQRMRPGRYRIHYDFHLDDLLSPDANGKVVVEPGGRAHETLRALTDHASLSGASADWLAPVRDLLSGIEHDHDVAYEVIVCVIEYTDALRDEMAGFGLDYGAYLGHVAERHGAGSVPAGGAS